MKKPRKKQRLKELIVREIKRYLDDPDTIEAVTAINYKDGTKTVNYNDMECALSVRLLPRFGFGNRSSFEKYRVFIPAANGSGAFGDVLSTPVIGQPTIGHTETFMSIHENEHTVSVALIFFVPLPLDYAIILMTLPFMAVFFLRFQRLQMAAEFVGAHAGVLLEKLGKMRRVCIADHFPDIADLEAGVGQQALCLFDAQRVENVVKALSCIAVKQLGKMPL